MTPNDPQVLRWITREPREEWAERWLLAHRKLPRYNAALSQVQTFLSFCWARHVIDGKRREKRRPRTLELVPEHSIYTPAEPIAPFRESRAEWSDEAMHLRGRGLELKHIATALGKPVGTIKSGLHRARRRYID